MVEPVWLTWPAVLLAGTVTGWMVVRVLVMPRGRLAAPLAGVLIGVVASSAGLLTIASSQSARHGLAASLLGAGSVLLGWALGASWLKNAFKGPVAPVAPVLTPQGDRCAVLLYALAEPPAYDPATVGAMLAELETTGVQAQTDMTRPLVYASERARYATAGGSPARDAISALPARVSAELGDGACGTAEVLYATDETLEARLERLAARGFARVVIAPVSVAPIVSLALARARMDSLRPSDAGMRVSYAYPLWDSSRLADSIVRRVTSSFEDTRGAGVALVSAGVPQSWVDLLPEVYDHEVFFVQRLRSGLVEAGFDPALVRHGWLDWQDPPVSEAVRHLGILGSRKVLVVPATIPSHRLSTLIDLPIEIEQARLPEHVDVRVAEPWGDDEAVAVALAAAVRKALAEEP